MAMPCGIWDFSSPARDLTFTAALRYMLSPFTNEETESQRGLSNLPLLTARQ